MAGQLRLGVGGGYLRRKFIGARGTVLAAANGVVDENIWLAGYLNAKLDNRSSLATNLWASWFQSGFGVNNDGNAMGATAAYNRSLTDHLSGTVAVGIDGVSRNAQPSTWDASALVGVRYSF